MENRKSAIECAEVDKETLRVFVWSVWNFFGRVTQVEPNVGTPYLFDEFEHEDYTGVLSVKGIQKGSIFFTLGREILDEILKVRHENVLKEVESVKEMESLRLDFTGEMVNIIAGNARNYLGKNFHISVPAVMNSPGIEIRLPDEVFGVVFPVNWNGFRCHLILALGAGDPVLFDPTAQILPEL